MIIMEMITKRVKQMLLTGNDDNGNGNDDNGNDYKKSKTNVTDRQWAMITMEMITKTNVTDQQ